MSAAGISKHELEIIQKSLFEAEKTCSFPWVLNYERHLPGTQLKLQQVFMIVGGAVGIINILIAAYLFIGHLLNWAKPGEQRQNNRVIFFVAFESVTTFLSITFYNSSYYITPVAQLYEAFAIIAVFLLYVHLVRSDDTSPFTVVEHDLLEADAKTKNGRVKMGWLKRIWIFVFQLVPTRIATFAAGEAVSGAICPISPHRRTATTAVTVVQSFCTVLAVWGIIFYERRMKRHLKAHNALFKLLSFKGIIILQIVQNILFVGLAEAKVFFPKPPYHVSYNDFTVGVPNLLFLIELGIMSIMFLWSFEFKKYRQEIRNGAPKAAGPVKAFFSTFYPDDVFRGLVYAFTFSPSSAAKASENHGHVKNERDGPLEMAADR